MPPRDTDHPSLQAPFVAPPPLRPQSTMGRNEFCWCGSGIKWKRCHKDRHLDAPVNTGQKMHELHQVFKEGFCSHPDANPDVCSGHIRAHTIQRRGGLSSIAERGHVISFKDGFQNIAKNNGNIIPGEVGLKEAATFRGFCGHHDLEMFRPIEGREVTLDKQSAFLLSFRALAYEHFTKAAAVRALKLQREADRGKPFEQQVLIQKYIYDHVIGTDNGMRNIKELKKEFDSAYRNRDYDNFGFLCVLFDEVLPVTSCGAVFPEFDFAGEALQVLTRGTARPNNITFNLTILQERTVAVFGWQNSEYNPVRRLVDSFCTLEDEAKADSLVRFAFEFIENTYSSPAWWKGLCFETREKVIKRVRSGINAQEVRPSSCLLSDGFELVGTRKVLDTYIL